MRLGLGRRGHHEPSECVSRARPAARDPTPRRQAICSLEMWERNSSPLIYSDGIGSSNPQTALRRERERRAFRLSRANRPAHLRLSSRPLRRGLRNKRRPLGCLGGVCEPRLQNAECCMLANTQLACLPYANGASVTTAHAIGSRRPPSSPSPPSASLPPVSQFSVSSACVFLEGAFCNSCASLSDVRIQHTLHPAHSLQTCWWCGSPPRF